MRPARCLLAALAAAAAACGHDAPPAPAAAGAPLTIVGADVSSLAAVEAAGGAFADAQGRGDPLVILRRHGVTHVRLRLFHTPDTTRETVSTLAYTLALAGRARQAGLAVLLDLHYSDTWADPGAQAPPAAWRNLAFDALRDSVRSYTRTVVAAFRDAGVAPDLIQLGNEVSVGFLHPQGRVDGDDDAAWARFAALQRAAREGVAAAMGGTGRVRLVHHVADPATVEWHMDRLLRHLEPPDVIAVSYYPRWHGDLAGLRRHVDRLAERYALPVLVVETAYPYTDGWVDAMPNVYGGAPLAGMPPHTPAGQAQFVDALAAALRAVPGGRGMGFVWWEPAWLPSARFGSPAENLTLFDAAGTALPALDRLR